MSRGYVNSTCVIWVVRLFVGLFNIFNKSLKMASEYERIRLRNIEDNKRILAELGLVNPVCITMISDCHLNLF